MFEIIGYFLEYYVDGKFIGTKKIDAPDREQVGYEGGKEAVSKEVIILDNRKTIKPNTLHKTYFYPLNGKRLK